MPICFIQQDTWIIYSISCGLVATIFMGQWGLAWFIYFSLSSPLAKFDAKGHYPHYTCMPSSLGGHRISNMFRGLLLEWIYASKRFSMWSYRECITLQIIQQRSSWLAKKISLKFFQQSFRLRHLLLQFSRMLLVFILSSEFAFKNINITYCM